MKQVLCFGDSNTWGYNPKTGDRFPWGVRWTSILQQNIEKDDIRVIEEGLCGRTTIFEDPLRAGRRGTALLPVLMETHGSPDAVLIMLGTNDCKTVFNASADVIAKGVGKLVDQVQNVSPESKVLVVSPIHLGDKVWEEGFDQEFSKTSVALSQRLENAYEQVAREHGAFFLKASEYAKSSEADQEHMDEAGHQAFAEGIRNIIYEMGI